MQIWQSTTSPVCWSVLSLMPKIKRAQALRSLAEPCCNSRTYATNFVRWRSQTLIRYKFPYSESGVSCTFIRARFSYATNFRSFSQRCELNESKSRTKNSSIAEVHDYIQVEFEKRKYLWTNKCVHFLRCVSNFDVYLRKRQQWDNHDWRRIFWHYYYSFVLDARSSRKVVHPNIGGKI